MGTTPSWISNLLSKYQPRQNVTEGSTFARYQFTLDRSRLIERMDATCEAIDSQAGGRVISIEFFLQPQILSRRYLFHRGSVRFSMALAILAHGPTLIFSSNQANEWVQRIRRRCGLYVEPPRERVVFELMINPSTVNNADLQQWFTYLLSGFERSHKPAQNRDRVPKYL